MDAPIGLIVARDIDAATRTRPLTGTLPIALITGRPRRTPTCAGRPTLTDTTRPGVTPGR